MTMLLLTFCVSLQIGFNLVLASYARPGTERSSLRKQLEKRDDTSDSIPQQTGSIANWFAGNGGNDTKSFTSGSFATGSGSIPGFGLLSPSNGLSAVFEVASGDSANITFDQCASQWQSQVGTWTYLNGTEDANATWWGILTDAILNQADYSGGTTQALNTATIQNVDTFMNDANQVIDIYVCNNTYTAFNSSFTDVVPANINVDVNTELRRLLADEGTTLSDRVRSVTIILGIGMVAGGGASCISWTGNLSSGFTYANVIPGLITLWAFVATTFGLWLAAVKNPLLVQRLIAAATTAAMRRAALTGVNLLQQAAAGTTSTGADTGNGGAITDGGESGGRKRDLTCSPVEDILDAANSLASINDPALGLIPFQQGNDQAVADGAGTCSV